MVRVGRFELPNYFFVLSFNSSNDKLYFANAHVDVIATIIKNIKAGNAIQCSYNINNDTMALTINKLIKNFNLSFFIIMIYPFF